MALFQPAALTPGQAPVDLLQTGCSCSPAPSMPLAPAWNYGYGYGYGYYPNYPQPAWNPAMWASQAYPPQGYYPYGW
jgi:hypothetical protein